MDTDSTSTSRGRPRLSSSTSDGLFGPLFARGAAAAAVGDGAWLQAMLDVEAALARACARQRLIPESAADAIAAACRAERFDAAALGREAAASAQPVVALVEALRAAVGGDAAVHVHHGATSQDVLDTAAMIVARVATAAILEDAAGAAEACAVLAQAHAGTAMPGRTLLQQALPTTFGLKAAGWMIGLDEAGARLRIVRDDELAVQLGGPVGTLASFGGRGVAVAADIAQLLGLAEPVLPWHTIRRRPAELAGALGALAGVLAKIARDITLLAQTEVGEAFERPAPARGGSSSMPHKHNPVAAVSALACATRVPGLVATLLAAGSGQEHERAAGAWQAEWPALTDLLALTGSAAAWTRESLERLEVDPARAAANLAALGAAVPAAADPAPHVEAAGALVQRALAAHRREQQEPR